MLSPLKFQTKKLQSLWVGRSTISVWYIQCVCARVACVACGVSSVHWYLNLVQGTRPPQKKKKFIDKSTVVETYKFQLGSRATQTDQLRRILAIRSEIQPRKKRLAARTGSSPSLYGSWVCHRRTCKDNVSICTSHVSICTSHVSICTIHVSTCMSAASIAPSLANIQGRGRKGGQKRSVQSRSNQYYSNMFTKWSGCGIHIKGESAIRICMQHS